MHGLSEQLGGVLKITSPRVWLSALSFRMSNWEQPSRLRAMLTGCTGLFQNLLPVKGQIAFTGMSGGKQIRQISLHK
jgi:hypothetical protein